MAPEQALGQLDLIDVRTDVSAIRDALVFGPEVAALAAPRPAPAAADALLKVA
jgi:hypothetical protein